MPAVAPRRSALHLLNIHSPPCRKLDQLRFDAKALQKSFEGILSRHQQLVRFLLPRPKAGAANDLNQAMPMSCSGHILSRSNIPYQERERRERDELLSTDRIQAIDATAISIDDAELDQHSRLQRATGGEAGAHSAGRALRYLCAATAESSFRSFFPQA